MCDTKVFELLVFITLLGIIESCKRKKEFFSCCIKIGLLKVSQNWDDGREWVKMSKLDACVNMFMHMCTLCMLCSVMLVKIGALALCLHVDSHSFFHWL